MLKWSCGFFMLGELSGLPAVWRKGLWSWVKQRWWVRGRGSPTKPRTGWVCQCEAPQVDEPGGNPALWGSLGGPGRSNGQSQKSPPNLRPKDWFGCQDLCDYFAFSNEPSKQFSNLNFMLALFPLNDLYLLVTQFSALWPFFESFNSWQRKPKRKSLQNQQTQTKCL